MKVKCDWCEEEKPIGHMWLTATYQTPPFDPYYICGDCQQHAHNLFRAELEKPENQKVYDFRDILETYLRSKK